MNLAEPILRIFHLTINAKDRHAFVNQGAINYESRKQND